MLGFSEEDVREIFTYYKSIGEIPADSNVEAIIGDMKPWYDNYCFSEDALETQSRVFNCDMVLYYLRNYMSRGEGPKEMIDPNTKTDYNKMKRLLQLDKLDGDRKGVIRTIAETGEIMCKLCETFPAHEITKPEIFPSLLFYYGMLNLNDYYYTAPKLKLNHGYCYFFMLPDLTHYATNHSYILGLKVLPKNATDDEAERQWSGAVEQINRYVVAPRVEAMRQGAQLHKIIMQFRGWELARMEEV